MSDREKKMGKETTERKRESSESKKTGK